MNDGAIERLAGIASPALSESTPRIPPSLRDLVQPLESQLLRLYWARNGFYAFESALHVYPLTSEAGVTDLEKWNSPALWRTEFGSASDGALFFAEDAFGGQFCVASGVVQRFIPETGEREDVAASVDEWAALILSDADIQTGRPLAHDWQARFGPLAIGKRLVPKIPFVLGGEYTPQNLHPIAAVDAMRFYADIAKQIHRLPDGSKVRLRVVD